MENKKVALVTGGTRGIGKAISLQLISEGYIVCVVGTKAKEDIEETLRDFNPYVDQYLYIQANIARSQDRVRLIDTVINQYQRLDVLVNNAGVAPKERMDLLETTEESFDFVNDINLKGTFFLTQSAANQMIKLMNVKNNEPVIINISSISAYVSSVNRGEYCISKAGMSMITKLFADRLSEYGILVYEVRPGVIYSDMTKKVQDKYDHLINNGLTAIKRWGEGEDVAQAVSVLCSRKLAYSTGEVINVDGGYHLRRL